MIRLLLRVTLSTSLLLTAAVFFIRFQPQDDARIRAVLSPTVCAPPCFMGINPGETTIDEAVDIIKNHPWVGEIIRLDAEKGWMFFEWSGEQPAEFDVTRWATLHAVDGLVEYITVPTHIPLVEFWLTAGKPDWLFSGPIRGGTGYTIGYSIPGVSASFDSPAPNRLQTILGSDVTLFYTRGKPTRFYPYPSLRDVVIGRAKTPFNYGVSQP